MSRTRLVLLGLFLTVAVVHGSLDDILRYKMQQNITAIPCVLRVLKKYFRAENTYAGTIVVVTLPALRTQFFNGLTQMLVVQANLKLTVTTHVVRKYQFELTERQLVKTQNYLLIVNSTKEITPAVRQYFFDQRICAHQNDNIVLFVSACGNRCRHGIRGRR